MIVTLSKTDSESIKKVTPKRLNLEVEKEAKTWKF